MQVPLCCDVGDRCGCSSFDRGCRVRAQSNMHGNAMHRRDALCTDDYIGLDELLVHAGALDPWTEVGRQKRHGDVNT